VILAAGRSERLSGVTRGRSKALQQLGGVPLVERTVRALLAAGIERVIVVVGHDADRVEPAARLAHGNVQIVRAEGWEAGNGASLAATEPYLAGEELFVLLCGDHVFADGALDGLMRSREPAVLVDPSPAPGAWAEGTRVRIREGRALAFGEDLPDPAIDCGAFVLPRSVFAAHRRAAREGDHSLSGAVTRLARSTPLRTVRLRAGMWWQDVDTPQDLRAARALVRRSLGKDTDGPVSRYLNRPISTRISMTLAALRLSPTLLSFLTFLVGMWGAWSLSAGRALMGGLLVQAASVLDGTDGETARLLGRASARGAFIDGLFDRMVDAAIVAALWLWAWDDPSRAFRIGVMTVSAIGWGLLAMALKRPVSIFAVPKREEPGLSALVGGRDARMLILALGSLANQPVVAFFVGMATYAGSGVWRVLLVLGDRRQRGLGGPAAGAPAAARGPSRRRSLGRLGPGAR